MAGLAVVYGLAWVQGANGPALISLALLAASVVTLPHALLVTLGLDAARWRQLGLSPRHVPKRASTTSLASNQPPGLRVNFNQPAKPFAA